MNNDLIRRKICIVTSTRADWGLLSSVARELRAYETVELQIIATNMHLDARYGMTVDEIIEDGFKVDERVEMNAGNDSAVETAAATGKCLIGVPSGASIPTSLSSSATGMRCSPWPQLPQSCGCL